MFGNNLPQSLLRVGFSIFAVVVGVFAASTPVHAGNGSITGKLVAPNGTTAVSSVSLYAHDASWIT